MLRSGVFDEKALNLRSLGKIHTQIVIEAEQCIDQNVLKVNSIHKKFLGFDNGTGLVKQQSAFEASGRETGRAKQHR